MTNTLDIWPLLLDLARLVVLVLLATKGGRYERGLAASLVPMWLIEQVAMRLPVGIWSTGAAVAAGLVFLAGHVWMLWRRRPAWLVAATLVQACNVALAPFVWPAVEEPDALAAVAAAVLTCANLACLALGALLRDWGPPVPVPVPAEPG